MHKEAAEWLAKYGNAASLRVVEIGSRNINGSGRTHWPNAEWIGIDRVAGPGVDVVADALDYSPPWLADLVVCAEALEHCEHWRAVVARARQWLTLDGAFVGTCAGPLRQPHSGIDGGPVIAGEYYGNLAPHELLDALQSVGFRRLLIDCTGADLRWWAA